ncbi:MAG: hypothetical protein HC768_13075 [Acaryochloris sp. CRU_2_0]|nr:hypothetical protein [Acaryochloris sp. CRU_2_0]
MVVDRGIDYHTIVKIESLPAAWLPRQVDRNDASCWKQCIKGEYFGASWDGRIDLFSQETIPPQVGDIALFEAVVAVHRRTDIPENPIEIREYVRLSHAGMVESPEKLPRLVWVSAKYKTTLKGLGRQYRYALKGAPLWEKAFQAASDPVEPGVKAACVLWMRITRSSWWNRNTTPPCFAEGGGCFNP